MQGLFQIRSGRHTQMDSKISQGKQLPNHRPHDHHDSDPNLHVLLPPQLPPQVSQPQSKEATEDHQNLVRVSDNRVHVSMGGRRCLDHRPSEHIHLHFRYVVRAGVLLRFLHPGRSHFKHAYLERYELYEDK